MATHEHSLPPKSSIKRWLVTTNHKDIGTLYILTSLLALLLGGALALLIRLQLWAPGELIMSGYAYNEAVTTHGLVMALWFLSPIGVGFANYVVPLQIGADDLAFPRLNALSYWLYLASLIVAGLSFFVGDGTLATGWTIYAPLNLPTFNATSLGASTAIMAAIIFTISVTIGTLNFMATIFKYRAEGMGLWDMPMFTWSIFLTMWMMLFGFAALLAAILMLGADHVVGTVIYQPDGSGSLLWTHLFWFFGHPEVYIVFYPALGVMFEAFQTFTGRRLVGRKWIIIALILIALQSFLVWMHHMFLSAINLEIKTLMMAMTISISLPFDLVVFSMIYTVIKGKIRYTTPFLFAFGALLLFILGGITGVFLGAIVLDYQFRGTYWVVAHFHYTMAGSATALFGGLYYWYPKITGKMFNAFLGKVHFVLWFIGFNTAYIGMFTGWESPRRVYNYAPELQTSHQIATVGAFLMGISTLVMFFNLGKSYFSGDDAADAPWEHAHTAEWAIPSPPALENWPDRPSYASGTLEFVSGGSETAADGGTVAGEAGHEAHADHASIWPLAVSASLLVMFFGLSGIANGYDTSGGVLFQALTVLGTVLFLWTAWKWGTESFSAPEPSVAETWPFTGIPKNKLGVWFFIVSDIVVFGSIISGLVFARISYGWMDWHAIPPSEVPGLVNTIVLLTSSFLVVVALESARNENKRWLVGSIAGTLALGLTFLSIKAWEWSHEFAAGHYPWTAIEESFFFTLTGMHALHVILGMMVAGFMLIRIIRHDAYLGDAEPVENFGLYWHFVDIVWVFLFPIFYLM